MPTLRCIGYWGNGPYAVWPDPLGVPADLASVVTFLLSDDAEWINGQAWAIDGGMSLRD